MAISTKQHEETSQTSTTTAIDLAERLESVKAGMTGAVSAAFGYGGLMLAETWLSHHLSAFAALSVDRNSLHLLVNLAIALLSGFLFGVTYRYVVRQDKNSHLGEGAVLAFGLVRSLAQIEATFNQNSPPVSYVVMVIEGIVLFAVIRIVLDWALRQRWVKPFTSG